MQIQSQEKMLLEVMDISTRSENHEHGNRWDFGKMKIKSYQFPMKQNNPTELVKMERQTPEENHMIGDYGTTNAVYGTNPNGCRGGNRFVQGDSKKMIEKELN